MGKNVRSAFGELWKQRKSPVGSNAHRNKQIMEFWFAFLDHFVDRPNPVELGIGLLHLSRHDARPLAKAIEPIFRVCQSPSYSNLL